MTDTGAADAVIHLAVQRHAAAQPDATALLYQGEKISYGALASASDAFAAELSGHGVGAGHVVPVLLPRSPLLVTVQLAVLKCGAAYANLDVRWPASRHAEIVAQISPELVVGAFDDAPGSVKVLRPPGGDISALPNWAGDFTPACADGSAPAMVIFTSGTTGGPKGVVVPHRAVTRLFGPRGLAGFGPGHATPQASPVPWDMYAFELWGQLVSGGCSVIVPGDHLLPGTLRDLVSTAGVDTVWLTTSLFNLFIDEDPDCFAGVRQMLTGGERLSVAHVRSFLSRYPSVPLWNGYGPVESCMLTTTHLITPEDCDVAGGIPVGRPVPGTSVLILDDDGQRRGAGEPGEICIAGSGLATCYLGQPELTAEKFPFVPVDGSATRIYRTGDIGVVDDNGVLHFRGRGDRQVKISGHRVEMTEIEAATRGLGVVRDCVALPLTAPDGAVSNLALFYITDSPPPGGTDGGSDPLGVREALAARVPTYLVPGIVRWLDRFPVTPNGKVDARELRRLAERPPRLSR